MRKPCGLLFVLIFILLSGQVGLCQEIFDIQKPDAVADLSYR